MNKEYIKQVAEEYAKSIHKSSMPTFIEYSKQDFIAGVEWLLKVQEEQAVADSRDFMD